MDLKNAAMSYCNIRLLVGGSISVFIGLVMIIISVYLGTSKDLDTSDYKEIQAKVKTTTITPTSVTENKNTRTVYVLNLTLEFVVSDKTYYGSSTHKTQFPTMEDAKSNVASVESQTHVLYYDPKDPSKNKDSKGDERLPA